jgi:FkbM family methyltransferase
MAAWPTIRTEHCSLGGYKVNIPSPQAKEDHAPYPFDVRRLVSVRRINIVLTLIALSLLMINSRQIDRRVRFWLTGKVKIDGLTFYLNPKDGYLTQVVLSYGTYEPEETRVFRSKCRPGDTVIDVGANVGWYTIIASKFVGNNGRVIAFEPEPENFAILKRNVLANGCDNVTLEQKALSNAAGELTLYLDEANKGRHSTVLDWKGKTIKVEALRLDDYLENRFKKVDFVKIDVEGAEPMVLEGMKRAVESNPAIRLVVEFAPERWVAAGHQPEQFLDDLIKQGFLIYIIDEAGRQLVPTTSAELLALFKRQAGVPYTNLFLQRHSD